MTENQPDSRAQRPVPSSVAPLSLRIYRLWGSFRIPLQAEFRFDRNAPFTVSVTFHPEDEPPITWRLSRELLYNGLLEASGIGDVQVWPAISNARAVVRMRLECRDMWALVEMGLDHLKAWLRETYDLVPPDKELDVLDWDGLVQIYSGSTDTTFLPGAPTS